MKAMKSLMLGTVVALAALVPLQSANAWDHGGGHWQGGGYHGGYHGHRGGYYGRYHGGGCRNCGAAVVGLAVGTIVGAAIANSYEPRVVVAPPPPSSCRSVRVNGVSYYNCDNDYRRPYGYDY